MALLKVTVESGKIVGQPSGNQAISVFKGIPYAKPPVGELRWRAPQPAPNWVGERAASTYSDIPMQWRVSEKSIYKKEFYPIDLPRSEDCLYANVWTPAKTTEEKLPVALWIYGGGFYQGYANKMETDGEAFAKRGVIYVSINYRLNIFGFLGHPELTAESESEFGVATSGNLGILDQIAGLKWVRENIRAFGGDPERITVFGQSAGAMSVQTLVSSSLTEGDIDKAILQSAGGIGMFQKKSTIDLAESEGRGIEFLEYIGASSIQEARHIPAETLLNHFTKFVLGKKDLMYFLPCVDGYVLEADWVSLARQGKHHDIPYMVGCTAHEGISFLPAEDITLESIHTEAQSFYGEHAAKYIELSAGESLETHIAALKEKRDILVAACGWSKNQNLLGRSSAYQYLFNHPIPASEIGTFHSSEHMYVFQTFLRGWRPYTGVDFDLSNLMCAYWTNFIKTGNPNGPELPEWTPYTQDIPKVMALNAQAGMIESPESPLEKFESEFLLGMLE